MNDITTLFNTFVFPVALCILLIWFMYKKIWPRIETTLDRVTKTNEELSTSNRILTENLVKKVDNMDNKLDKVLKEKGEIE
ncbi:iduronate sulfatase [Clostridium sp. DSM 100503]|uniref:iduronate sulfatase n=1 Tax=Clostridium sp. DSM 100503 TaxID=2963282 RepID=UPI00214A249F|nr:iduronate sulfatase [Clostridium sp. DSM 100503]MCR1952890.1 iduronate sulfatase [Clostridium sp. DSM 100503]